MTYGTHAALTALMMFGLAGCMEDSGGSGYTRIEGLSATTEIAGRSLRVVDVQNEPFGHILAMVTADGTPDIEAGPYDPAIRIEGAAQDDFDTALRAFAEVCGFAYDAVKDWGAFGDPIWQDPRDNAVVLYGADCPGLKG